ncbi:6-bladed beta-propeller [Membranicola marinus]|uniref:6-bladed beta-propeller n=1 Tax=Membranihabitans marinus TaxID=1227546 RepID=A0A953I215_9BACT|nr:6-bladed beta-propeller [Membranihabitans marinus]MBY5959837.1 6-bladed beta-propeller [Membranihabitans marinus]
MISIDPKDAAVILAPDLYKNLHFIPLETNIDALVDGWHKTKLFDDYIGVLNEYPNKKFMLFDREGKYLWHKDSGEKEPGSIFATGDFTILDDKIYFPDHRNKSIHIYDVRGKYLKTVFINNSYSGMLGVGDYIVFSAKNTPSKYNEANQNVVFYDKDLQKILNFGSVPKHLETNNLYDIIYRSYNDGEILYHQVLTATIHRIGCQGVISY